MAPSAAVWPTSDCLAAGCGELVKVWQPGDPNSEIKIFEGTSVYCVDFSRNNKVLAVAGDKGQVVVYSNKPQPPSGERSVGRFPDLPKAGLDCITCVRFAPNDTHLVGGARNGTLRIWSLRSKEEERILTGLSGSTTSVAINSSTEMLASASSSGQVLLHDFKSGQKWKSLVRGGAHAAGSLCFNRLSPGQLAAGNGCGQLLVWDLDTMELSDDLAVHKGAVTGLSFSEAAAELMLSCGADGTAKCTDRRTQKAVWSVAAPRGCSFSSLSAKHDGQLLAVGTSSGSVQVHDVRRASQVVSVQQFSDTSSPVTTVRWQHLHMPRGSSRAASASVAPSSTVTPSASAAPTASAAVSSAVPATWQRQQQQAPALLGQRGPAAVGGTAAAAGAGKSPGLLSEVSNTSVSVDFGMRALSPVHLLGSAADEAESAPPLQPAAAAAAAAAPITSTMRTPAAPQPSTAAGTAVTPPAVSTPADSLASAGPGAAPFMFTPGIGLGHLSSATTTPVMAAADPAPMSRATAAGTGISSVLTAAAQPNATTAAAMPELAAEAAGRLGSRRSSSSNALDNRQAAGGAGKAAGRATLLSGVSAGAGSSGVGAGSSVVPVAGGAASGKGNGPSRGNSGISSTAAAAAAAGGGGGSKASSRPSSGGGSGGSAGAGTAAGGSRRSMRSTAEGSSEAPSAAAAAGGDSAVDAANASVRGSDELLLPASRPGSAAAAAVGGLREDVFKAYVDQQMADLKQDVRAMHLDMLRQFHQAQMDLVSVVDGVVQRQDQLAEMMAELAAAVQGLRSAKQQPGGLMPWI